MGKWRTRAQEAANIALPTAGASEMLSCLLPVDERARKLLLGEPTKNVKIVVVSGSQGERITDDFRCAGFRRVECYGGGYFQKFVAEPVTLSSF